MVDLLELALIAKAKAALPEATYVMVDEGQDTSNVKGDLPSVPAILISLQPFDTRELSGGVQDAVINVEFKLITKSLRHKEGKIRHSSTGHSALASKLYVGLTGKNAMLSELEEFEDIEEEDDYELFNSLTRLNVERQYDSSALQRTIQVFQFYAKDYSALPDFQTVTRGFLVENL